MDLQPTDVQPAQPQAQSNPIDTPEEQATALPPDVLKLHPIQALIAGTPAAVSMHVDAFKKTDEAKDIVKNADQLKEAGFGFYRSLNHTTGVIFNALHVHPEDLLAADKAGKLEQIAPPWNRVAHAVSKSGLGHPALSGKGVPQAPATATPPPPPQSGQMVAPEPASAQTKTQTARLMALQPGAPTSGPAPGQGRLLNSILKPVV